MDHAALIVAKLDSARQKRGLSIAELGRRADIEGKRLWYILNGKRNLHADELVRLCVVLGIGLHQLLTANQAFDLRAKQRQHDIEREEAHIVQRILGER